MKALMMSGLIALVMMTAPPARAQEVIREGPSGGLGGAPFDELSEVASRPASVHQFAVKAGDLVDGLNVGYDMGGGKYGFARWHGGTGGLAYTFDLQPGEYVTSVSGTYGRFLNQIRFGTNTGRTSPTFGATSGQVSYSYQAPTGFEVIGLSGRAGDFVDAIGVILRRRTP